MNNQQIIDQINALEPCGAKLRAVLLALAGAPEPKPTVRCFRHKEGFGSNIDRQRWTGERMEDVFADGTSQPSGSFYTIDFAEKCVQRGVWLEVPDEPYKPAQAVRCFRHKDGPTWTNIDRVRFVGERGECVWLDGSVGGSPADLSFYESLVQTGMWLEVPDAPYQKPEPAPDLPYCLPADVKGEIEFLCDECQTQSPCTVAHVRAALEKTRGIQ